MKRRAKIIAIVVAAIIAVYLLWQKRTGHVENPVSLDAPAHGMIQTPPEGPFSTRATNALGDILTDAQDPEFINNVFPKFREFVGALKRLGVSPFETDVQRGSCSKIRIIHTPNGIITPFVIGDSWTADYTRNGSFEGITHFGQRGADNPYRAISHANTNALRRLSERAITMPEAEVLKIENGVADAFGIDPSQFEKPQMFEEGLFEYHLGIYTVRYRKKGSDPINQLNYTREFSLKATSPTTAVLVSYSHLAQ